jgi:hypothetical protein
MEGADGHSAHRPYEDMAVAHVLGGLDSDQGRIFRAHLLECSDCRARVGELRAIASDLATVERDERRERSAKAVETKRRQEEEQQVEPPSTRPVPRWALGVLVLALVGALAYAVVLRGNVDRLEQALVDRLDASAALEHGEELDVRFSAAGVTATAKANGNRIVLLMEGMDSGTAYGVYLVDDQGSSGAQTIYRNPLVARDGKVFVLLPLQGPEDRLVVTAVEGGMALEPDGRRVFEVAIPPRQERPDSIGSA